MFRIDPHQARTDLYGIGKGAAQVIDFSQAEQAALMREKQQQEAELKKRQLAAQRGSRVMGQLGELNKLAIMPRDIDYFDKKKQDLYDNVKQNWNRIENNDTDAIMAVNQQINNLMSEAEQSKNLREESERRAPDFASDKRVYRDDSKAYFEDFMYNKANAGKYDYDPTKLKPNLNFTNVVKDKLLPMAIQGATDNAITKTFTEERAKELIKKTIATDPQWLDQAQYDFERDPDKYGAKDAVEYYMNKYAPSLVIDRKHPSYYTGFGEGPNQNKKTVESHLDYHDPKDWNLSLEYVNKVNVKPKMVRDPNNPNRDIEVIPQSLVHKGDNTMMEAYTVAGRDATGMPIPGKRIKLDYVDARRIAQDDFGIDNIYDMVENGNIPEHINMTGGKRQQHQNPAVKGQQQAGGNTQSAEKESSGIKITAAQQAKFNADYAKLKIGESLIGPDGKTYKKTK